MTEPIIIVPGMEFVAEYPNFSLYRTKNGHLESFTPAQLQEVQGKKLAPSKSTGARYVVNNSKVRW